MRGLARYLAAMLLLIDGYNVIAPAAPPGRGDTSGWLQAERARLLERLGRHLDPEIAGHTHVIFDSATSGFATSAYRAHGIQVRFAVDHREADDLIEELIAAHCYPKRLTVISSDHRLQVAARRAGATVFDSQKWLDALLDGKLLLAPGALPHPPADNAAQQSDTERTKPEHVDEQELQQWMQAFGVDAQDVDPGPFPEGYGEDLLPE